MKFSIKVRLLGVVVAVAGGCLYNAAERCGPGQLLDDAEVCVCARGHVPVYRDITVLMPTNPMMQQRPFSSCTPCGANEVVSGDKCVCGPGYVLAATGCIPSNLGTACASDADCATGDQRFCRLPEGYCTRQTCATNADCNAAAEYVCETTATPPYCQRPPPGQGRACTMTGPDPTCSTEAPLCVLNACTVSGCQTDAGCSPGRKCCDLTKFGQPGLTLCLKGSCP